MKTFLLLLLSVLGLSAADCGCPVPLPGCECFPVFLSTPRVTNQIHFGWYVHQLPQPSYVGQSAYTRSIALQHMATNGVYYEIQYKTNLNQTIWLYYTGYALTNTDWVMTFHPVYPCDHRFFRICYQKEDDAHGIDRK